MVLIVIMAFVRVLQLAYPLPGSSSNPASCIRIRPVFEELVGQLTRIQGRRDRITPDLENVLDIDDRLVCPFENRRRVDRPVSA
jgi:hypothetical protein